MQATRNPSAWDILTNTGTSMTARHRVTGEAFTGTPEAFRSKLQNEAGVSDFVRVNALGQLVDNQGFVIGQRKPQKSVLTVYVEGDSRADIFPNTPNTITRLRDIGVPVWASAYAEGVPRIIGSGAVGGTTSTEIANRLTAAIPSNAAEEIWVVEMGINNMHSAAAATYDPAVLQADTLRVVDACRAAGKILRIGCIRPVTTAFASYTDLLMQRIKAHRLWMLQTLTQFPHVRVIDTWDVRLGSRLAIETGSPGDGIHISPIGAQIWGKQWAESVYDDYELISPLSMLAIDVADDQLNAGANFEASGGTLVSNITGAAPANCRLAVSGGGTITGTSQIIQSPDGRGNLWRINVTDTSQATSLVFRFNPVHTLVAAGNVLEAFMGLSWRDGNLVRAVTPELFINNTLQSSTLERSASENLTEIHVPQSSLDFLVTRLNPSGPIPAPSGQAEQGGRVSFGGAGGRITLDMWLPRLRRVSI